MSQDNKTRTRDTIPESFGRLLRSIRKNIFQTNATTMAKYLVNSRRLPNTLPKRFRHDSVNALEARKQAITFEHIETYSRLLGLPTCALSFVSRYQHEGLEEAERVAEEILAVVQDAKKRGRKRLGIYELHILATRINIPFEGRPELPTIPLDEYISQRDAEELAARRQRHNGEQDELF